MKVRNRSHGLYKKMQEGGLPVFRGRRMRGAGLFSSLLKRPLAMMAKKVALRAGKNILRSVGPKLMNSALETGSEVISGKTSLKKALKNNFRKTKETLKDASKAALKEEIARYQKGGSLTMKRRSRKGRKM